MGIKKTLHFTFGELSSSVRARFLLVDYVREISNFDLMKDLKNVVDYIAFQYTVPYIYDT